MSTLLSHKNETKESNKKKESVHQTDEILVSKQVGEQTGYATPRETKRDAKKKNT